VLHLNSNLLQLQGNLKVTLLQTWKQHRLKMIFKNFKMSYTRESVERAKHKILIFHSQNAETVTSYYEISGQRRTYGRLISLSLQWNCNE